MDTRGRAYETLVILNMLKKRGEQLILDNTK
jgi:hypothetical protein